jgi:hypothetical protein
MFVHALVPLAALLAAAPVTPPDGSWLAWHGCWRTVGEDAPEQVVCMLPGADPAEVRLRIIEQGAVTEQALVRTDGTPRTVQEGGCTGTETGRWSRDGRRVFIRAELDCQGVRRVSSAVLAMVAENEWVDVQTVTVAGQHSSRTRRYRAITGASMPADIRAALDDGRELVRESARLQASAPLEIEDVIEATSQLPAPGVEALLAARQHGFGLDARKLVQLEQARVPSSVIDVMVALSYPQSFAVREPDADMRRQPTYRPGTAGWPDDCYDDRYFSYGRRPLYSRYGRLGYDSCYDRYGYGWGSRYGSWNDSYYGWRGGGGPVVVIVRPVDDEGEARQPGQAIKGRGYTRGSGSSDGGSARPRSTAGSADSGGSAGSKPTTSTGSSGTSTGRTAKPRTGGGGS